MRLHMDVAARLEQAEKSFSQKQAEREQHLKVAEDCLTEMTKLQGEYRILQEFLTTPEPNIDPTKIEAVEDKSKKKVG